MITITNISPDDDTPENNGPSRYRLKINDTIILDFNHVRKPNGVADCLRDAAKAFDEVNALKSQIINSRINQYELECERAIHAEEEKIEGFREQLKSYQSMGAS